MNITYPPDLPPDWHQRKHYLVPATARNWGPYSQTMEVRVHPDDGVRMEGEAKQARREYYDLAYSLGRTEEQARALIDKHIGDPTEMTWKEIRDGWRAGIEALADSV